MRRSSGSTFVDSTLSYDVAQIRALLAVASVELSSAPPVIVMMFAISILMDGYGSVAIVATPRFSLWTFRAAGSASSMWRVSSRSLSSWCYGCSGQIERFDLLPM